MLFRSSNLKLNILTACAEVKIIKSIASGFNATVSKPSQLEGGTISSVGKTITFAPSLVNADVDSRDCSTVRVITIDLSFNGRTLLFLKPA